MCIITVVGSLVPWITRGAVIATQARVDTDLGRHGIALVEQGVSIDVALPALLAGDPDRERRQVHGRDARRGFCHSGRECVRWFGHEQGQDFSVAGNMLAGPEVIGAMASAFRRTARLDLAERLLLVLEAGQAAGGDKRGKQSAALLVAAAEPRMYHNLRVDDHADPVAELRRVFDVVVAHAEEIDPGVRGLQCSNACGGVSVAGPERLPPRTAAARRAEPSAREAALTGWFAHAFGRVEDLVYIGLALVLAALAVGLLIEGAIAFGRAAVAGELAARVAVLLDRILLILMVVEILYTVQVSLREHTLVPEPFLVVGLIAGIRRILVLTAEFSDILEQGGGAFTNAMLELSVLTAMVLALVAALVLLRRRSIQAVADKS